MEKEKVRRAGLEMSRVQKQMEARCRAKEHEADAVREKMLGLIEKVSEGNDYARL